MKMKIKTRILGRVLVTLAALGVFAVPSFAQNYTAISAAHIQNGHGTALATGSVTFQATDEQDRVISFQVGGGGLVVTRPFSASVVNGAVASFNVANPGVTAPLNIRYHIQIVQGSTIIADYRRVYLCAATGACTSPYTFNLDTCVSTGACQNNPIPIAAVAGTPGTPGANGTNGTNGTMGAPFQLCPQNGGVWNSGSTFSISCAVTYMSGVYGSLQLSNTNHQPDISPTWWLPLPISLGGVISADTYFGSGSPSYDVQCTNDITHDTTAFLAAMTALAANHKAGLVNLYGSLTDGTFYRCQLDGTTIGTISQSLFTLQLYGWLNMNNAPLKFDSVANVTIRGMTEISGAPAFQGAGQVAAVSQVGNHNGIEFDNSFNVKTENLGFFNFTQGTTSGLKFYEDFGIEVRNVSSTVRGDGGAFALNIDGGTGSFGATLENVTLAASNGSGDGAAQELQIKDFGSVVIKGRNWLLCTGSKSPYAVRIESTGSVTGGITFGDRFTLEGCGGTANLGPYDSMMPYALGERVTDLVTPNTIWESLMNGNTGHTPASSPTYWKNTSGAMIDFHGPVRTVTVDADNADAAATDMYVFHDSTVDDVINAKLVNSFLSSFVNGAFSGITDPAGFPIDSVEVGSDSDPAWYTSIRGDSRMPRQFPYSISRGRAILKIDDLWRANTPVTVRKKNLVSLSHYTDPSTWVAGAGATITPGATDYLGGTSGGTVSTAGSRVFATAFNFHGTVAAGDIWIAAVPYNGMTGGAGSTGGTPNISLDCFGGPCVMIDQVRTSTSQGDADTGRWQWGWTILKFTSGGTQDVNLDLYSELPGLPVTFARPIVTSFSAGEITDAEAIDFALHLTTYSPLCDVVGKQCDINGPLVGVSHVELPAFDFSTDVAVGDGAYYFTVPASLSGKTVVSVSAQVISVGTTGTTDIQFAKCSIVATGDPCSGTVVDILSTKLTIDSGENKSSTAATPAVINGANAVLATDQVIRVDVDAVSGTAPKGLIVDLGVQ